MKAATWIWLAGDEGKCPISTFHPDLKASKFVMAEFRKELSFDQKAVSMDLRISADVKFWLWVNGSYIGAGPVCAGGDFGVFEPMPWQYYNTYEIPLDSEQLEIRVLVQNRPSEMCDMSQGRNGLWVSGDILLDGGGQMHFGTDESWEARVSTRHFELNKVDNTVRPDPWGSAVAVENVWRLRQPDIPMLAEEKISAEEFSPLTVASGESKELTVYFDRIYSIYHGLKLRGSTSYTILFKDFEREEHKAVKISDHILGEGDLDFRGLSMVSAGGMKLYIHNTGNKPLVLEEIFGFFVHYPVEEEGSFACSEPVFDRIYEMGKHALKICRQTIELDSPMHQENLGCAGDYAIASLMNYFTFGDARLTRLDIVRIADALRLADGYMFHTTYGMIWIQMVWDYCLYTADESILKEVWDAIELLLAKMHSYTNPDGIIDDPPSYMFVDWLVVDGMSLHHPPMALGQAALNAFYHGGLLYAVKIGQALGRDAECYAQRAAVLKAAFRQYFYDARRGLYFDGRNDSYTPAKWLPENVQKRYYSWHTNALAVLYDLAPRTEHERIMETILGDMTLINPQPYFMHFVLEAIYKTGLFEKYGIQQLMRWKDMTDFPKGLAEGWYDMSGYGFDYSHVWAGTPTYQLPSKLSGLEILEPGFKKIRLRPNLYGLDWAKLRFPSPYGFIEIHLEQGKEPVISVPEGIQVIM